MTVPARKIVDTEQNPKSIGFMWIFAVLWCSVSFPVFWMFAIQARQVVPGIVSGLFAAFGLIILFFTAKATLEYVKFGQVDLTLDGEPAVGRDFGATIRLPASPALTKLTAELACVQLISDRDTQGKAIIREADAWTLKQEFPVRRGAAGAYAALRFDVPADRPPTTTAEDIGLDETQMKEAFKDFDLAKFRALHTIAARAQARGSYRWELRVQADVPGIDLDRTFKLHVLPLPPGATPQAAAAKRPGAPAQTRIDPAIEARVAARSAANRKLSLACFIVAVVPFLAPFVIAGLAVGLAGCPLTLTPRSAVSCEFLGINWGPLMAGAFDKMPVAVPAGIGASMVIYLAGSLWLGRGTGGGYSSGAGIGGALAGLAFIGIFLYQFGVVDFRGTTNWVRGKLGLPVPGAPIAGFDTQAEQPRQVAIAVRGIAAASDGNVLTVRVQEMRLEKLPRDTQRYGQAGAVVYRAGDWPERSYGYAWQDVRGELTRDAPVASLANRVFEFGGVGPRCADGGCEVRFFVVVETGAGATTQDRTEGYRLARIASVAPVAHPARGGPHAAGAWAPLYAAAMESYSGGRDADTERLLRDTLVAIGKHQGEGQPASARVHYQLSLLYERQKKPAEQEKELLAAQHILFNLPDKVVKEDLAPDTSIDLEAITRRLADFYWEQRRYAEARVHYQRAQQYLSRIEVSEPERNRRLARNAAGRMATACSQQDWGEADQAMTELKARIADVDLETRRQLEYWVRTGEPRLAARKC